MKKQIIEYILRVIAFIILTGALHTKISTPLMYALESCFGFFYEKKPIFNFNIDLELLFGIIVGLFSLFMACISVTYIFAKICGLFKKLDSLKKWQGFLILFLISFLCYEIADSFDKHRLVHSDIIGGIGFAGFTLIPSYLFYLYLNHLTKKYPKPFEKIGYYTSIQFWKDIFKKLCNQLK